MKIEDLEKKFEKYKLSSLFKINSYLTYNNNNISHIAWKYKEYIYNENPFYHKEPDDEVVFCIDLDEMNNSFNKHELRDKDVLGNKKLLINSIILMYKEIIAMDWSSFQKEYLNNENEVDFSNVKFKNHLKTFIEHHRFVLLEEKNIDKILEIVEKDIEKNGVGNQNYSIIFDMLESLEYLTEKTFRKNYEKIYDKVKNSMIKIIKNNPDFYTEERKFYTYKKIYCDVFRKRENIKLINEINSIMNFTPDTDYYKNIIVDNNVIVYPNVNYEFLDKYHLQYRDFNKQTNVLLNIFEMLAETKDCPLISSVKLDKREIIQYKENLVLNIDSAKPHLVSHFTNKVVDLLLSKKGIQDKFNRTNTIERKDRMVREAVREHAMEEIKGIARELSLRDDLEKSTVERESSKAKKKI